MKIVIVCLVAVLACSCQQAGCRIRDAAPADPVSRHDEVLMIMRQQMIHDLETNADWLPPAERRELARLKKDYDAEVRDRDAHPTLVIPGRGWVIRGPLTISQVEQESLKYLREQPRKDVPQVPFGFMGDRWVELKSKHRDGDELYFYRSDQRSWADLCGCQGYVLIRKDEMIDGIVTVIN